MSAPASTLDERVLVLAPSRRDAPTLAGILQGAGVAVAICPTIDGFCAEADRGFGAAVIAEEVLGPAESPGLLQSCLERQPRWSEPSILIVTAGSRRSAAEDLDRLYGLGNIVLLERPLRAVTLLTAVRSALRGRRRQLQLREHLAEREATERRLLAQERELRSLTETLEQRVRLRTGELEESNRRLVEAMDQRQRAEQALVQAQKMEAIGQLTGGIAHDFNNLLMVVLSGVDMLERGTDQARRDRILSGMRQAASRGRSLTQQLLAFSRHMELKAEAIDLGRLLDGMRVLMGGALRGDILVEMMVPPELWPVLADATQLELAILNAVFNARDAMPEGGRLVIEAANAQLDGRGESGLSGDFVRLEIRDSGTGIPPELLHRVFDPFFTTKAVGRGTGLGLSQVYGFAKQSGGHVKARSRPEEGTSIILHLPRAGGPEVNGEVAADRAAPQVAGGGRRVLLVEDNDAVAAIGAEMLEALGFAVTRAGTAPEALRILAEGAAYDLMLSDIVMPGGMSGLELAREVRQRRPDLPILLVTGYSEAVRETPSVEGIRVLRKPYSLETLEGTLTALLGASV